MHWTLCSSKSRHQNGNLDGVEGLEGPVQLHYEAYFLSVLTSMSLMEDLDRRLFSLEADLGIYWQSAKADYHSIVVVNLTLTGWSVYRYP